MGILFLSTAILSSNLYEMNVCKVVTPWLFLQFTWDRRKLDIDPHDYFLFANMVVFRKYVEEVLCLHFLFFTLIKVIPHMSFGRDRYHVNILLEISSILADWRDIQPRYSFCSEWHLLYIYFFIWLQEFYLLTHWGFLQTSVFITLVFFLPQSHPLSIFLVFLLPYLLIKYFSQLLFSLWIFAFVLIIWLFQISIGLRIDNGLIDGVIDHHIFLFFSI